MTKPTHCPGMEPFKTLQAIMHPCPKCGTENEIFADEKDKTHSCVKCGTKFNMENRKITPGNS